MAIAAYDKKSEVDCFAVTKISGQTEAHIGTNMPTRTGCKQWKAIWAKEKTQHEFRRSCNLSWTVESASARSVIHI